VCNDGGARRKSDIRIEISSSGGQPTAPAHLPDGSTLPVATAGPTFLTSGMTAFCAELPLTRWAARELATPTVARHSLRRLSSRSQRPRSRQEPDRRSARTRWPPNAPPSPPSSRPYTSLVGTAILFRVARYDVAAILRPLERKRDVIGHCGHRSLSSSSAADLSIGRRLLSTSG
jgi:hypothetical protein